MFLSRMAVYGKAENVDSFVPTGWLKFFSTDSTSRRQPFSGKDYICPVLSFLCACVKPFLLVLFDASQNTNFRCFLTFCLYIRKKLFLVHMKVIYIAVSIRSSCLKQDRKMANDFSTSTHKQISIK